MSTTVASGAEAQSRELRTIVVGADGAPSRDLQTTEAGAEVAPSWEVRTAVVRADGAPSRELRTTVAGADRAQSRELRTTAASADGTPSRELRTTEAGADWAPSRELRTTVVGANGAPSRELRTTEAGADGAQRLGMGTTVASVQEGQDRRVVGLEHQDASTINYLGVVAAAGAAFVASSFWYSPLLFGTLYLQLRGADPGTMAPSEIVVEFLRTLVVTYVLARLVAWLGVRDWKRALRFGLWVWIGFPTMILLGSVAHENVPLALSAIHAGDWLVKVLILALVPVVFRTRAAPSA